MKDNWIKPFQDKLGEYELELPASPAGRGAARILPLALAGAAAAVLLLVLLLRAPGTARTEPASRLIAEVTPAVAAPQYDRLAPVSLLPKRGRTTVEPAVVPTQAAPATTAEAEAAAAAETFAAEEPAVEVPAANEPAESEVSTAEDTDPAQALADFSPEEMPASTRVRLAGRVHVDPSFLRNNAVYQQPVRQLMADNYLGPEKREGQINYWMNSNNATIGNDIGPKTDTDEGEVRHDLPVKTGVSILLEGPRRFSLEGSLNYDFHRSRISYQNACELDYRMHYAGLAVKGLFTIADWERVCLYTGVGVEGEIMVAGRLHTRLNGRLNTIDPLNTHPFIVSLNAAAGAEYKFSERFGIYAEPGFALHSRPKGNLPDYYRDHRFSFDLHVGFRFSL